MIGYLLKLTLRRTAEFIATCVLLSAFLVMLLEGGILFEGTYELLIAIHVLTALFIFLNVKMMRECLFELHDNLLYFVINLSAYAIFVLINFLAYKLCSNIVYTWLFSITKFAKYNTMGFSSALSAVIFQSILGISIFLAPIGMKLTYEDEEELLYEEMMEVQAELSKTEEKGENKANEEKNETKYSVSQLRDGEESL